MAKFLDKTGLGTFWAKIKSTFQTLGNLVTAWGSTPSDTKYPSEKLVKTSLDGRASSSHTHTVKINGADKTIAATGGTAVNLGTYTEFAHVSDTAVIGNDSPAADCKTYFVNNVANGSCKVVYCKNGQEYTIIFSKQSGGAYGNIIKYGCPQKYIYILRYKNGEWQSDDWEKISAGYADGAAFATKAKQDSDGNAINSTYFKSSGNTTLVSGTATKIGTQNGADVKLTLPTIPSGAQLVYDCGAGSTSGTDFDNALAAFNAGRWVIIHQYTNVYYCVGTYNSGLRFKRLTNDTTILKVDTLNWTRGSAPTAGTALEAALVGHTHSNYVPTSRKINGKTLDVDINLSASDVGAVTASKSASQGSNETSLVTRGEKYKWENKQDALPSTWDPASAPTYGIALDECGIDKSLKNITNSTGGMTTDTYILVHDRVGEISNWRTRHINKLWDWVKSKIASVLNLYTRDNDTPYFNGLAANAVQAIKATNANITRTADTANGDKLQIGTGTAVNITNAGRANYADGAGYAISSGTASSADIATKAEQDATGATLAPLVVKYQSGSFPDVFNQLATAYASKRRIFCLYGLEVAGSSDSVEVKIPLSSVRFDSNDSIESFEFVTSHISRGSASADIAGQIIVITANHLANGSYNWGIEYQWPYASNLASYANTAGTADNYNTSSGTIKTALDGKASASHKHAASDITSGTFGPSRLDIGDIRKSKNYLVPKMPILWLGSSADYNLMTNTDSVLVDVRNNGYGTPITVINGTASTITVSGIYPNKGTTTIPARKSRIFTYFNSDNGFFDAY